jgi:hypothetical protein
MKCYHVGQYLQLSDIQELLLTLIGSTWSAVSMLGLSPRPTSVVARTSIFGLLGLAVTGGARVDFPGVGVCAPLSSAGPSVPMTWLCSSNAPPRVTHLSIIWMSWFCFNGFDRYSYCSSVKCFVINMRNHNTYVHLRLDTLLAIANHGVGG